MTQTPRPPHSSPPVLRKQRDNLILLATQYEIPPASIARALDMTETRVRQIIKAGAPK